MGHLLSSKGPDWGVVESGSGFGVWGTTGNAMVIEVYGEGKGVLISLVSVHDCGGYQSGN